MNRIAITAGIAACAADVRAMDLAGLCVTSWSVHLYPKSLQYPLWEFAAKRLKDPSESAEADFASLFLSWLPCLVLLHFPSFLP